MLDDTGKLLLRLTLGGLLLLHGIAKIAGGVGGIAGMLQAAGLPAWVAYGAYVGEIVAPLMVIFGFYARVGDALIAVNMLFAVALVHRSDVFELTEQGGWAIELQAFFLFTAIALVLMDPGRLSLNRR